MWEFFYYFLFGFVLFYLLWFVQFNPNLRKEGTTQRKVFLTFPTIPSSFNLNWSHLISTRSQVSPVHLISNVSLSYTYITQRPWNKYQSSRRVVSQLASLHFATIYTTHTMHIGSDSSIHCTTKDIQIEIFKLKFKERNRWSIKKANQKNEKNNNNAKYLVPWKCADYFILLLNGPLRGPSIVIAVSRFAYCYELRTSKRWYFPGFSG